MYQIQNLCVASEMLKSTINSLVNTTQAIETKINYINACKVELINSTGSKASFINQEIKLTTNEINILNNNLKEIQHSMDNDLGDFVRIIGEELKSE